MPNKNVLQMKQTSDRMKRFSNCESLVKKHKISKMIMVIVGIFVLCNCPLVLNYLGLENGTLEMIADFLITLNSSTNAIVYGIFSKKYQEILVEIMSSCGLPQCNRKNSSIEPQENVRKNRISVNNS